MSFSVVVVIWMKRNKTFSCFSWWFSLCCISMQFVWWVSLLLPLLDLLFQSTLSDTSVIGAPVDGIRFDWYWFYSARLSWINNISEYDIPFLRRYKVSTGSFYPVFLCIVNDNRTWSFDGKVFGSSAVIFELS